jgi:hypothetical protein
MSTKEREIEDRKDKRTKIQASQQSEMIAQRNNDSGPVDFESGSNGLGGIDLASMSPR